MEDSDLKAHSLRGEGQGTGVTALMDVATPTVTWPNPVFHLD